MPSWRVGIVGAWLRWRAFSYTVAADELVIADGIVTKSRRSIPLERIQDVSIEQKPLARIFGLAIVKIETGGGEADEASLDSVSMAEAARLRATLRGARARACEGLESPDATADIAPDERTVFAMDLPRVLLMGAFGFSLVWIGAIFACCSWATT